MLTHTPTERRRGCGDVSAGETLYLCSKNLSPKGQGTFSNSLMTSRGPVTFGLDMGGGSSSVLQKDLSDPSVSPFQFFG